MNKDDEIKNDWQYLDMKRDMRKHVGDTAQRHYRKFPLNMSKHYKELEKPGAYVDYISDEMTSSNNPWKNESKNMNKKLIRLTEGDLHRIVKESVNRILNEVSWTDSEGITHDNQHGGDSKAWDALRKERWNRYFKHNDDGIKNGEGMKNAEASYRNASNSAELNGKPGMANAFRNNAKTARDDRRRWYGE